MIEVVETTRKPLKRLKQAPVKRKPSTLVRKPKKKKRAHKGNEGQIKRWSLKKADERMSIYIRMRDGRCMFPDCTVRDIAKLQCSHYIGRAHKATRFDPNNLIALCWFHHFKSKELGYEYQKQRKDKHGWDGQYTLFMQQFLGETAWNALMQRAEIKTYPQKKAIEDCMAFLKPFE